MNRWIKARLKMMLGAIVLGVAFSSLAAPIPFVKKNVQLTVREQSLPIFLQDLFNTQDIPVVVSPSLMVKVNGDFSGSAEEVYNKIARAYGLVTYFDGTVAHIYSASEVTTRTLSLERNVSNRVVGTALQLRLTSPQNTIRPTSDGALLLTGTPRFVEQVEELAKAQQSTLSMAPSQLGVKVFPLRYAWAQDVSVGFGGRVVNVPGVASTVRAMMAASGHSQLQAMQSEMWLRPTVPNLRGQGLAGHGNNPPQIAAGNGVNSNNGSSNLPTENTSFNGMNTAAPQGPPPLSIAEGALARVEADPRLNAVIVRDAPSRMSQYESLIASLDVEPLTLEIEATIIDVDTDRARELGINWRATKGRGSALFGNGSASDGRLYGNVPSDQITPIGKGGYLSAVLGDAQQFVARINAMEEKGAAKVVSSPQVVTLSNVEAVFDSSKTFYVRVAGREQVDLFNVSAGTVLRVTPHVFKDKEHNRIKLLVQIDDGEVSQEQVDQIPIVERSAINTQALIFEGESLLLGGLTKQKSSEGITKIPLLGDIPLLGNLFKYSSTRTSRTERMFLISPRIAPARNSELVMDSSDADAAVSSSSSSSSSLPIRSEERVAQ
jgi:type III secretion protein C